MNICTCINRFSLNGLDLADRLQVFKAAKAAIKAELALCVAVNHYDVNDTALYYVGAQTPDWVDNYYQSGGTWSYQNPSVFLR